MRARSSVLCSVDHFVVLFCLWVCLLLVCLSENSGTGSLLNRPSSPPDDQIGQGTELNSLFACFDVDFLVHLFVHLLVGLFVRVCLIPDRFVAGLFVRVCLMPDRLLFAGSSRAYLSAVGYVLP